MLIDQDRAKTADLFHSMLEPVTVTTVETVSASSLFLALSTCFEPETAYCRRLGRKKERNKNFIAEAVRVRLSSYGFTQSLSNIDGTDRNATCIRFQGALPTGTILGIVVHLHWLGLKSFSDLNLETAMCLTPPHRRSQNTILGG